MMKNESRFRDPYTFEMQESDFEYNTGELVVVPDESYTIPELFAKYAAGIDPENSFQPEYSDSEDFDDVDTQIYSPDLDLTDIDRFESELVSQKSKNASDEHSEDGESKTTERSEEVAAK